MVSYKNGILDAVSAADPVFVRERAESFSFVHGDVLSKAGEPVTHVYFPYSGLISVVVDLSDGERIETAMVGRDGVLGGGAGYGADISVSTGLAQIPGQAWRMPAADLAHLAATHAAIRQLLVRHDQFMLAQAQQMAACSARHHIPARLCSWLMRAQELSAQDEMLITQEFLARSLGVQRASISLIAGSLQEAGLIQYRRGRLTIVDRSELASKACECHRALRRHQQRLSQPDRIAAAAV